VERKAFLWVLLRPVLFLVFHAAESGAVQAENIAKKLSEKLQWHIWKLWHLHLFNCIQCRFRHIFKPKGAFLSHGKGFTSHIRLIFNF